MKLIDATRTTEKDLSRYDLVGFSMDKIVVIDVDVKAQISA